MRKEDASISALKIMAVCFLIALLLVNIIAIIFL